MAVGEIPFNLKTIAPPQDAGASDVEGQRVPSLIEIETYVRNKHNEQRTQFTSEIGLRKMFDEELEGFKVISFDIFDTLLVRRIDHPINVFFFLKDEPAFRSLTLPAPIHDLRIDAENSARQMLHRSIGSGEVNLAEIYAVFCKKNGLSLELVNQLVAAEEAVERKLCFPSPLFLDLYTQAKNSGKQVIVASDMYLRKPFLKSLLDEKGFPVDDKDLFVSSDMRVSKQSGDMFRKIFSNLKVEPKSVLHLGDHPISDFSMPQSLGVKAILHPYKASSNTVTPCQGLETLTCQSYVRGMIRATKQTDSISSEFWSWLGYQVFGPFVTGFCTWLHDKLQRDGIERAWFLLRDGELPSRVYKTLYPQEDGIKVDTLPSSRRAFVFPTLELAPQFALPNLICCIKPLPVRQYLDRLNIDASKYTTEFELCGFSSLDQMVDARVDHQKLFTLLSQPRVLEAITQRSKDERNLLTSFFKQEGLLDSQRVAVIDLGWNGTIQKATHHLLASINPKVKLKGYYVATKNSFAHNEPSGMQHESYLVHRGNPANIDQLIHSCYVFLEIVFSSINGSLNYFQRDGSRIYGVVQSSDKTSEQESILSQIHNGTLRFANDFYKANQEHRFGVVPGSVAAEKLLNLITAPTPAEAARIGSLMHSENYGTTSHRYVAKFGSSCTPQSLLEDFDYAYWKVGLVSQNNEQARLLRDILWLNEHMAKDEFVS